MAIFLDTNAKIIKKKYATFATLLAEKMLFQSKTSTLIYGADRN
jgi:hypothetical protein